MSRKTIIDLGLKSLILLQEFVVFVIEVLGFGKDFVAFVV
jgi:hypothetical protein